MIHSMTTVKIAKEEVVACEYRTGEPHAMLRALLQARQGLAFLIFNRYGLAIDQTSVETGVHVGFSKTWVEAVWRPDTSAVALIGGPEDGLLLDYLGAPEAIVRREALITPPIATFREPAETCTPTEVSTRVDAYECIGWTDTQHAWAYSRV